MKNSNHDPFTVLRERMNGKTYGEIAKGLRTDVDEVMSLAKIARQKLGANRNQQAVAMLREREPTSTTDVSFTLSPTQERVGDLLIEGKTNGEIATEMQISVHTVKTPHFQDDGKNWRKTQRSTSRANRGSPQAAKAPGQLVTQ